MFTQTTADLFKMLSKFGTTWHGHLEQNKAAQLRIRVSSADGRQIPLAPYRANPKACKYEKNEIVKMLKLEVIKLNQTKWALPIAFDLRKTVPSYSA